MRTSTFKRNWMLHYIQPEYLYLPRRKEEEEKESCEIAFTYAIYKRLDAEDTPIDTKILPLAGYLFKDNTPIEPKIGTKYYGSIFTIDKKGNYYFVPRRQYVGSFIPENRKFKISIQKIEDETIFVYGIDMARTSLFFCSEEGSNETIQQLRSFIGFNFEEDEGIYRWSQIRMPDLLMLQCKEESTQQTIPQGREKRFTVGSDDKHFTVQEGAGEHLNTYYGDWHLDWQYKYEEYENLAIENKTDILCKTINSDFTYTADYFHYVEYYYSDMYKSSDPPVYPIPLPHGKGKHYLSTTFCYFEGDGFPPDPETGQPSSLDPLSGRVWYHNLYCDQHICYIPKVGGKVSLSKSIKEGRYEYKLVEIGLSVVGTDQEISSGSIITRGKGPYSLSFDFVIEKDDAFDEEPPVLLSTQESGVFRLNIDGEDSEMVKWLTYLGMRPVVTTNDFEGYTRMLEVDGRKMYDPLVDNYGKRPPNSNYKKTGRHNREDIVKGNISDELWDERKYAGYVNTIVPFIFNNPRNFDYNNFSRYESSNPVELPYENVYVADTRELIFFHTACHHDYMSLEDIDEIEEAEDILLNGEERILGEEYRAAGGVYVDGECIIYP